MNVAPNESDSSTPLTEQMEKTIRLLQNSRNPASSDVLAAGLEGPPSALRQRIVLALSRRNDERALFHLAQHFESFDLVERSHLTNKATRVRGFIPRMFLSAMPQMIRSAIAAVGHFEYSEFIDQMIRLAEDTSKPQSVCAQDELLDWASRLGVAARVNGSTSDTRLTLLYALRSSVERYSVHRSDILVDAFVSCLHWDDAIVHTLLSDPSNDLSKLILRSLRHTSRPEILDFLGGFLWRRTIPASVLEVLKERCDIALGVQLGGMAANHMNSNLRHNLSILPPLESLQGVDPSNTSIPIANRTGAWLLLAHSDYSRRKILVACTDFLKLAESKAFSPVCDMLRSVPALEWSATPETNPEQDSNFYQENLTKEMLKLLEIHPDQPANVQGAIAKLFDGFSYDQLCKQLDRWDESMLFNAAWIVRTLEIGWEQRLLPELSSPSPIRRLRAARAMKYLGIPNAILPVLHPLLYDSYDEVRVCAVEALSVSGRKDAEDYLLDLLNDISSEVRYAAQAGMEIIEQSRATN